MTALLALVLTHSAFASTKAERDAEVNRLSEEIERLGQKLAWQGVERKYQNLISIRNGRARTDVHLLAAHAALSRGDIRTAWERAQRGSALATTAEETQEAAVWIADFWVNYGEVSIELSVAFEGTAEIQARDGASFSPKTRLALNHANTQLNASRMFHGFLPMGRYTLAENTFDIVGGPKVDVFVRPVKQVLAAEPIPSAAPAPTPPKPEPPPPDRVVVLGVRGGGWTTNDWLAAAEPLNRALSKVDGVIRVTSYGDDADWIRVKVDEAALVPYGLTVDGVAGIFGMTHGIHDPVVDGSAVFVPPGRIDLEALSQTMLAGLETRSLLLDEVAVLELGSPGDIPMPVDPSEVPRYRVEITVRGGSPTPEGLLLQTANEVANTEAFALTLEAHPGR